MREILRAEALAGVPHGFLTGLGHEGEPDPARIVAGAELVRVKQVHSPRVVFVEAPFAGDELPEADALVTDRPGLVLGVVTADCAPVLLADRAAGVVGAAHAGWRGAFGGVLEATVAAMIEAGATRETIVAAIGPTIAQASYEVDQAFHDRLVEHDADNAALFAPGAPAHHQFDLPAYVRRRLESAGIGRIDDLARDTYTEEQLFHSFRRATHRGEPTYGRQFSLIACPT
ncbi:peptidoglycan editing factor PgeF [Aurantiacibacter xanthus]|uniref:Purine nucleoside phosphorylase n=1 Tax=Aurantiacibacter xanthus TaxID=1784712 RepID=A0A3A1P4N3_9SPHN|nr:peptidoglycan editing factor PgeF [Aurantiacibacter xanthus]RIV81788.1 peptidoglycan editing factor PgeF [Aurantiacibacter xanthus]